MDEKYPIGQFAMPTSVSNEERASFIEAIAGHPAALRNALSGVSRAELETRYRDGGWTVRQVVHHLADSHINSYVRFRLALTEDQPRIKTYDEARWAELPDVSRTDVDVSLRLLDALHERWTTMLRALEPSAFARPLFHPEWGVVTIDWLLAFYAWHGAHHVAHIRRARERSRDALAH